MKLTGVEMRTLGASGQRKVGDIVTIRGQVHDSRRPAHPGEVLESVAVLAPPPVATHAASLQAHVFVLDGSTLTGTGVLADDGVGTCTIIGGSGGCAGARGTYTVQQSADHVAGGTATYPVDLV